MKNMSNIYSDIRKIELLFCEYYNVLCAYSFRFVNDMYAAEDIVQDVFFELWAKREKIDFDQAIKAYLFKAVYNRSLNYVNNPAVTRQTKLEQYAEEHQFNEFFVSQDKSPEELLITKELTAEIEQIIDKLPSQCKTVFLLSRKEELKNKEIAEKLSISVKAVEKHITKALSILKKELKDKGILLLLYLIFQN